MLQPLRQKPLCGATVLGWCLIVAKLTLVLAMFAAQGCASTQTTDGPSATIQRVQSWWDGVCGAGHEALTLARRTVETLPVADAGAPDAAPVAVVDASTESDR